MPSQFPLYGPISEGESVTWGEKWAVCKSRVCLHVVPGGRGSDLASAPAGPEGNFTCCEPPAQLSCPLGLKEGAPEGLGVSGNSKAPVEPTGAA